MAVTNGKRAREELSKEWTLEDKMVALYIHDFAKAWSRLSTNERDYPKWVKSHLEMKGWNDAKSEERRFRFCHELLGHSVVGCHRIGGAKESRAGEHLIRWKGDDFCKSGCKGHQPILFASTLHLRGCPDGKPHSVAHPAILADASIRKALNEKIVKLTGVRPARACAVVPIEPEDDSMESEDESATEPQSQRSKSGEKTPPSPVAKKPAAKLAPAPITAPTQAPALMPPMTQAQKFLQCFEAHRNFTNAAMVAFTAMVRANQELPVLMRETAPHLGEQPPMSPVFDKYLEGLMTASADNEELRKQLVARASEIADLRKQLVDRDTEIERLKRQHTVSLEVIKTSLERRSTSLEATEKSLRERTQEVQTLQAELARVRKQLPNMQMDVNTAATGMEALARHPMAT